MRHLLFITLALFIWTSTSAKCTSNGIYCLTQNSTIDKNGLIILEFYASSQGLVSDLNKKYPIFLKSQKEKVTLLVLEILVGQKSLTQVILKPEKELNSKQVYNLEIDNLPKYESKPILTISISDNIDKTAPVFTGNLIESEKSYTSMGCGPSVWVYFKLSNPQDNSCFVRTTLKNVKTGLSSTFILKIENGIIKVGHSMCSGAFAFIPGEKYEVSFQLIDQAGNKSSTLKNVSFISPLKDSNDD